MVLKKFTWPAELTLTLIGGKWKGLILHLLLTGESKRFGELKKLSQGISAKILAKHLKELEYDGLITRMVTGTDKPRIVYAPTERSRSLAPILEAIQQWGENHLGAYGPGANAAGVKPAGLAGGPAAPVGGLVVSTGVPVVAASGNLPGFREPGPTGYGRLVPDIALIS